MTEPNTPRTPDDATIGEKGDAPSPITDNIKQIQQMLFQIQANMVTKDDIANMATKDDIANMATKDDIANMATKEDIAALREDTSALRKDVERLDKLTGILVEEKVRSEATHLYGAPYSQRFLIKSVHDVVKLVSKANYKHLLEDDQNARNDAVNKIAVSLVSMLRSVLLCAHRMVAETAENELFKDSSFDDAKSDIANAKGLINDAESSKSPGLKTACGLLIKVKNFLGKEQPVFDGEANCNVEGRAKMIASTFGKKLDRIKKVFEAGDLVHGMSACNGPGILICGALANYHQGNDSEHFSTEVEEWMKEKCNIFSYQEEVECDLRGSVSIARSAAGAGDNAETAIISCGEIKESLGQYNAAKKQLIYRLDLIQFVLQEIFGKNRFNSFARIARVFFLEGGKNAQVISEDRADGDTSFYVH